MHTHLSLRELLPFYEQAITVVIFIVVQSSSTKALSNKSLVSTGKLTLFVKGTGGTYVTLTAEQGKGLPGQQPVVVQRQ